MSPKERAAMLRVAAGRLDVEAARLRMAASATLAAEAMRGFGEAVAVAESREVAEHPDLAELNIMCDALYLDHR